MLDVYNQLIMVTATFPRRHTYTPVVYIPFGDSLILRYVRFQRGVLMRSQLVKVSPLCCFSSAIVLLWVLCNVGTTILLQALSCYLPLTSHQSPPAISVPLLLSSVPVHLSWGAACTTMPVSLQFIPGPAAALGVLVSLSEVTPLCSLQRNHIKIVSNTF